MTNIVDSSGWLEYFADSVNAKNYAKSIEDTKNLIVPVITIYEVFKKLLIETDEDFGLLAIAHMQQGTIIPLDSDLSIIAALLAKKHKLPIADSLILATARKTNSHVLTQDADFKGIEGVKYFEKK